MPLVAASAAALDVLNEPVDFDMDYEHPQSATINGLRLEAAPFEQDSAASSEVLVEATLSSSRRELSFSAKRVMTLDEFQELGQRVQAIAPWGEDGYYPDQGTTERVWDAMAKLLKGAADAPDVAQYLADSDLGIMTRQQL